MLHVLVVCPHMAECFLVGAYLVWCFTDRRGGARAVRGRPQECRQERGVLALLNGAANRKLAPRGVEGIEKGQEKK